MLQGAVLAQHRGAWSSCCRLARHTLTGLSSRAQGSRFASSNRSETHRLSCLERVTDNQQYVVCGEWHRAQKDAVTFALLLVLALRAPPAFSKATSSASPTAIHPRCSTPSRSSTASASPESTRPRRVRPFAFALARTWRVLLSATPSRSADTSGTATGGWPARSGWPRPTPAARTVPARRRWKPASRKLRSGSAGTTGSTWASRAPRTGSGTPSRKGRRGRGQRGSGGRVAGGAVPVAGEGTGGESAEHTLGKPVARRVSPLFARGQDRSFSRRTRELLDKHGRTRRPSSFHLRTAGRLERAIGSLHTVRGACPHELRSLRLGVSSRGSLGRPNR